MEDQVKYGLATNPKDIKIQLTKEISMASMIAGMKITPDVLGVMVEETYKIISTFYPGKRILDELPAILRSGVIGDYGEDTYLCVRNINTWLKRWAIDQRRLRELSQKKEDDLNKIPMQTRASFLFDNIDKLPSLKAFMGKSDRK